MANKESVAIIGSGPAGLCAAYILRRAGYEVVVFEKAQYVALAGHSYRLMKDNPLGKPAEHASEWKTTKVATDDPSSIVIDIPLRVFSGTYYTNWFRMLDHLGVSSRIHRFHYTFTDPQRQYTQYFSNFHRILPSLANGLWVNLYLLFWYLWFTAACFWVPPRTSNSDNSNLMETFDEYHQRIGLPTKFVDWYILPLFSSVATCSHDDLRQIPADYIVRYRKGTIGFDHRTACMDTLERRLTEGVSVKLGQTVSSVESEDDLVRVEHCGSDGNATQSHFNHVILAISAAEATKIHHASAPVTSQLRTRKVSVKVHRPAHGTLAPPREGFMDNVHSEGFQLHTQRTDLDDLTSHSTHYHPSGMVVTVSPMIEDSTDNQHGITHEKVDHTVHLMRPLVSPKSHALLQDVFGAGPHAPRSKGTWRNGDGNVYIAGGYASAGLPLLENCLRSAIEAAVRIGATPPFPVDRRTTF
ncbi:hypothetical protein FQN54_009200 [Arachnomyces sp. PD_36]|nr:hypothetical protein FQN54_009200 [Arachnomyces sp. PD_36]